MQNYNIQFSISNISIKKIYFLIFSYVLSIIITIIVYISGGTLNVFANLMYIPIAIISGTNGVKRGALHALISALLLGPLMPLDVSLKIMQSNANCITRVFIYLLISFIIGYIAEQRKEEFEKNISNEKQINKEQTAMIFALAKLSESRDNYLDLHIERVGLLCKILATKLQNIPEYSSYINNDYIENIYKASQLHDIGKVGIPDRILLKPGKLSTEEFDVMKTHTTIGANTLREVKRKYPNNKFLDMGINIAQYHHEKWNGTGYPEGISGENIPLSARIMAIVDVYDALRTKRVYKEAYSHVKSMSIIRESIGVYFDPTICNVFLENEDEFKNIYEQLVANGMNIEFEY